MSVSWSTRCLAAALRAKALVLRLFHRQRTPSPAFNPIPRAFELQPLATEVKRVVNQTQVHVFSNASVDVGNQTDSLDRLRLALDRPSELRDDAIREFMKRAQFDTVSYQSALAEVLQAGATLGHVIELRRKGSSQPVATVLVAAQGVDSMASMVTKTLPGA